MTSTNSGGSYVRRKGSTHDRTGCLTCRSRRKRCIDKTRPTCGACTRLGLPCFWDTAPRISAGAQSRLQGSLEVSRIRQQPSSIERPIPTGFPQEPARQPYGAPSNRLFMQYYIDFLAHKLSADVRYNSFLSAFVPMAMESQALQTALIAFSSANWSYLNQGSEVIVLENNSRALTTLGRSIRDADIAQQETNLAACLVLSTSEISQGHRHSWFPHLQGARQILLTAHRQGYGGQILYGADALKGTPEGRWLLRNFAYHDIMGSIVSGYPLLLKIEYAYDILDEVDSYFGVASTILISIARINSLGLHGVNGQPTDDGNDADLEGENLQTEIGDIERNLLDWQCILQDSNPELHDMAHCYRNAALLLLYGRFYERDPKSYGEKIIPATTELFSCISRLPTGSYTEGSMLFPHFMAGVFASSAEQVAMLRSRMHIILSTRGFRNIEVARTALDLIWSRTGAESESSTKMLSWPEIRYLVGDGLSLS